MDKRGLTIDPNLDLCSNRAWYETLGPTQKPSPYATASWRYVQKWVVDYVRDCGTTDRVVFDNGSDFNAWLQDFTLNGGIFNQPNAGRPDYDEMDFRGTPYIQTIFASVRVYDSAASNPGPYDFNQIALGLLAIDSDQVPVSIDIQVDIDSFVSLDNGPDIQDPMPNPNPRAIFDAGLFQQWGAGIRLDNAGYQILPGNIQINITSQNVVFPDGSMVETEGTPDGEHLIEVSRGAVPSDDNPPGKLLGELNYELRDCELLYISDWSHYNWMDDTPVRKAFKALMNSLPPTVKDVTVRDAPHAFWTSLGFIQRNKGDEILHYKDYGIRPY